MAKFTTAETVDARVLYFASRVIQESNRFTFGDDYEETIYEIPNGAYSERNLWETVE